MARSPDWYSRLEAILATLGTAEHLEWLGRAEMSALFGCSERDSIRLLHKFGAVERGNALTLDRASLLPQLEAIAAGSSYAAYPNIRRWLDRMKALPSWKQVNATIDGYAASLKGSPMLAV